MTKWVENTDGEPTFSMNDFKKWMDIQSRKDEATHPDTGVIVEAKVSIKKLISRMEPDDGELYELAKDFRRNGGKVIDADGETVIVEVASGTFRVMRNAVRKV